MAWPFAVPGLKPAVTTSAAIRSGGRCLRVEDTARLACDVDGGLTPHRMPQRSPASKQGRGKDSRASRVDQAQCGKGRREARETASPAPVRLSGWLGPAGSAVGEALPGLRAWSRSARQPPHLRMLDIELVAPDPEHCLHRDVRNRKAVRDLDGPEPDAVDIEYEPLLRPVCFTQAPGTAPATSPPQDPSGSGHTPVGSQGWATPRFSAG